MSSKNNIPMRRPRKRKRLKAYADKAPMNTVKKAFSTAMITEALNHRTKNTSAPPSFCTNRPLKFSRVKERGMRLDPESVWSALNAAETTYNGGSTAMQIATHNTRCRHQWSFRRLVESLTSCSPVPWIARNHSPTSLRR